MIDYKKLNPKQKLWVCASDLTETFECHEYFPDTENEEDGFISTLFYYDEDDKDGHIGCYKPEQLFSNKKELIDHLSEIINRMRQELEEGELNEMA